LLTTLQKSIFFKYMVLFGTILISIYIISYVLMKNFLLSYIVSMKGITLTKAIISEFNFVFMEIAGVSFVFFFIVFYVSKKTIDRVNSDVKDIKEYLEDINAKDYKSVIKIKHYVEFLEISLLLKNIVKRLKQKDSKK